ncbi:MAG: SMP-30/gluconolactonase/LRE family protein [Planctomycetaceae bacterium]|nr:SMP-30/gluconolactonase/LRE family protein [Planctomycetaceae bacterium]
MRSLTTAVVLIALGVTQCLAADGPVEKVDIFQAGEEGFSLYRIPGLVVTKSGTVLAYCEARKSDKGDWGPIDILMRRSTDGGRTWGARQTVVHVEGDLPINPVAAAQNLDKPGDNTANNPVAIADLQSGAVHFLYCLEYMRCFYMRSDDDGATWSEPVEITNVFEGFRKDYDWKVLATGPCHAIQLQRGNHAGRLVVPVWLSTGTGGHAHRPSVTATITSDDHGKTWHAGEIAVPNTDQLIYPNETVLVETADGKVMLNTRSESLENRRLTTQSSDGATKWSTPEFDPELLEPVCMAGMVRVRWPLKGRVGCIAFTNPNNLSRRDGKETPGKGRDRANLSIRLSDDEGNTWSAARSIEPGFSGYSDLAVAQDGTILCLYERGSTDGENIYRPTRLTVARISESWVRAPLEESPVDSNSKLELLAEGFGLADGPSWNGNDTLYFPDVKGEKLLKFDPRAKGEKVATVIGAAGRISATFWSNGKLYLSDNGNSKILIWDGKEVTTLCEFDTSVKPPPRPNDLVVDAAGGAYVTLTSQNRVAYVNASGEESTAIADIAAPNGIILSPDGRTLYVAAYAAKQIWSYPVSGPGKTGEGKLFASMDDGDAKGADGMSIDALGNVYCAGATDVWIWNVDGKLLDKIACPARPINCGFGDEDLRTLYITGFDGLSRIRMTVQGVQR